MVVMTFLFSTVGSTLRFSLLNGSLIGNALIVIVAGVVLKVIVTFLLTYSPKYNLKERLFMAIGMIPKTTLTAAVCSIVLTEAQKYNDPVFIRYGEII